MVMNPLASHREHQNTPTHARTQKGGLTWHSVWVWRWREEAFVSLHSLPTRKRAHAPRHSLPGLKRGVCVRCKGTGLRWSVHLSPNGFFSNKKDYQGRRLREGERCAQKKKGFFRFLFVSGFQCCALKEMIFLHTEGVLLNCKRRGDQSANGCSVSFDSVDSLLRSVVLAEKEYWILSFEKRITGLLSALANTFL